MVLEYLQIQNKACASLCFSASPPRIGYLSLWMHEGLSSLRFIAPRGINATRNMRSRLAIKFPPPMSSDQMPAPGKTKLIKFPPSWAGKDVKCPGCAGGGMFKLRFDGYIRRFQHKNRSKCVTDVLTTYPGIWSMNCSVSYIQIEL